MASPKTSQDLRMLSMSLSDCQSLTLNVMIQVSQFVRNSVTKSLTRSQYPFLCLCLLVGHAMSPDPSDQSSDRSHVSTTALHDSEDTEIKSNQKVINRVFLNS